MLTTRQAYEPNWLVESVDEALPLVVRPGGTVVAAPFDIPVDGPRSSGTRSARCSSWST